MKVLKCCANCSNRDKGVCCCSLPDTCNEYVDIPDNNGVVATSNIPFVDLLNKEMYELQIADLEAKLAEKEKAFDWLHEKYAKYVINAEKELFTKKVSFEALSNSAKKYQIIFAVEQLEKVKEILLENLYDLYSKPSEIWDKYGDLYDVVVEGAVNGTIDNQINELKEGK